jgi:conjugative relaxase-like TrwC/TraI family protein
MGLAKISPDGWRYYAAEIATGAEDYFLAHGEEAGRWIGAGANALGLSQTVDEAGLGRLFGEGRHPITGATLGRPFVSACTREGTSLAVPVAGYALSFSPPKSVSILWALAGDETSQAVRDAHDAAVQAALEFLEEHAAFTRRGRAGAVQADTDGYVAAGFVHRTSRAGDPQLHTHVLVANKVRASSDGHWLTLDGRELYKVQKAAGLLYKSGLRAELSARLGVAWAPVDEDGGAEIVGVPPQLVAMFSKRRQQVDAHGKRLVAAKEAALGRSVTAGERAAIYQLAAYQSRAAKQEGGYSNETLRARWRAEATQMGADPDGWLGRVFGRRSPSKYAARALQVGVRRAGQEFVAEVIEALETKHSTWGRADLIETLALHTAPSAFHTASQMRQNLEAVADLVMADSQIVALTVPIPSGIPTPLALCRRDGMDPTVRHGGLRYSTRKILLAEQAVLEAVEAGRTAEVSVASALQVEAAVEEAGVGGDQAEAVRRICQGGEQVAVLVGPAGSGKSSALTAARAAWQAAGVPVRGVAPSAVAAGALNERAGVPAETVAKFLLDARKGRIGLQRGEVVLCDEASMVATRDLAALVLLVRHAGAKLVLIGDHHQLGAVEAGGLFRLLVADAKSAELTVIRRFSDPWEAQATSRLRQRDPSILAEYQHRDRVRSGYRDTMVDTAHQLWLEARARGQSVLVMAADHDTVDQLALRARATCLAAGQVEPDGVTVGAQLVGVGDEVVTTRNDRRLLTTGGGWVSNGDRWKVLARYPDNALTLASLDGRGRVTLPGAYTTEHLALAYAVTVHKSQGVTVDQAVIIVDGATSGEHLYVGMTRGRHLNQACVVCEPQGDEHHQQAAPSAADVLTGALRRSSSELSATEMLRAGLDQAVDVAALQAALAEARRRIDSAAGPDRSREIGVLRPQATRHAQLVQKLGEAQTELARLSDEWDRTRAEVAQSSLDLQAAQQNRRLWRGPDRHAQTAAEAAQQRATNRLTVIEVRLRQTEPVVSQLLHDCEQARKATDLLKDAERSQQQRTLWLQAHPDVVGHIQDLLRQLRQAIQTERVLRGASAPRAQAVRPQTPDHQTGTGDITALTLPSSNRIEL